MKRISDSQETIVRIPVIVPPIEVELTPVLPLIEVGHIAIAVSVPPDRA